MLLLDMDNMFDVWRMRIVNACNLCVNMNV